MKAHRHITSHRRARVAKLLATLAVVCPLVGCSVPTAVPPPPSGGTRLVLSYAMFATRVEPVLGAHGCDVAGDCHGGGIRGTLELSPPTAKDTLFDYDQVALQVSPAVAESSDILLRPLTMAAGGRPHPYKTFADTTDPGYQSILAWIRAGVRQ
jgi:hypothetical protein